MLTEEMTEESKQEVDSLVAEMEMEMEMEREREEEEDPFNNDVGDVPVVLESDEEDSEPSNHDQGDPFGHKLYTVRTPDRQSVHEADDKEDKQVPSVDSGGFDPLSWSDPVPGAVDNGGKASGTKEDDLNAAKAALIQLVNNIVSKASNYHPDNNKNPFGVGLFGLGYSRHKIYLLDSSVPANPSIPVDISHSALVALKAINKIIGTDNSAFSRLDLLPVTDRANQFQRADEISGQSLTASAFKSFLDDKPRQGHSTTFGGFIPAIGRSPEVNQWVLNAQERVRGLLGHYIAEEEEQRLQAAADESDSDDHAMSSSARFS